MKRRPVFMFGLLDAYEVGAAGSAHRSVTVRVSGEFVRSRRIVEGEAEGGKQGRPPWFRPGRGPLDWGVCDDKGPNLVAVSVEPLVELGWGNGEGRRRGNKARQGGEDRVPVRLVPVGGGGRSSEAGGVKHDDNRDMVGSCRGQGGVPRGEGWHQMSVGEGEVKD